MIGLGTFNATPEMFALVNQVLRSGRISYGPMSQEFEQRLAAMHDCQYGVLSNSGTSSLLVALQTLKALHGWQKGDEVIVPALTFVATVNVVLQARLKPVLVDIEPDFYGINVDRIEQAITPKTRAIIPVHTFGQPCNMAVIRDIAKEHELRIIEDACETILAKHKGVSIGAWSDIAVFSFYVAHLLVTGIGGMAITNDEGYAQHMRSLVNHGIDLSGLPTGEKYDVTWFNRQFSFSRIGHSFRISEFEAALGVAQLDSLALIVQSRRANLIYLNDQLKPLEDKLQLPAIRPLTTHSAMMYPLVCRDEGVRDNLMKHLNDAGIGTRLALPLTRQPVYKGLWQPDNYPIADLMNRNAFYIPSHQNLSRGNLDFMADRIWGFYGRN